jgi:hypothetical protein
VTRTDKGKATKGKRAEDAGMAKNGEASGDYHRGACRIGEAITAALKNECEEPADASTADARWSELLLRVDTRRLTSTTSGEAVCCAQKGDDPGSRRPWSILCGL